MELKGFSRNTFRLWMAIVLFLLALVAPALIRSVYGLHLAIMILFYIVLGECWNLVGGYAGQLSFAHASLFAFGAYSSSLLLIKVGIPPYVGLFAAGMVSGIAALVLGFPCFTAKLKGHYFALATVGFAEVMRLLFLRWQFVGMAQGLSLPPTPSLKHFVFVSKIPYYYAILSFATIVLLVLYIIVGSKLGLYLKAIRENEEKARHLGINTRLYKLIAFFISAFFVGISGTFYAQYILHIDPQSIMTLNHSIKIALVAIVGGIGTLIGPIIGSFIVMGLDEGLRVLFGGEAKGIDFMVFGIIVTLIAIFEPRGISKLISRITRVISQKYFK